MPVSRRLTVGLITAALTLGPIAVFTSSAAAAPAASRVAVASTTTTAPPATTAPTTTAPTIKSPSTVTYTVVVAGTFKKQASADARLAKIVAKGITGLAVVQHGKRFRIEESGLAQADAKALVRSLRKAHYRATYHKG
jgi:hypothetical protein